MADTGETTSTASVNGNGSRGRGGRRSFPRRKPAANIDGAPESSNQENVNRGGRNRRRGGRGRGNAQTNPEVFAFIGEPGPSFAFNPNAEVFIPNGQSLTVTGSQPNSSRGNRRGGRNNASRGRGGNRTRRNVPEESNQNLRERLINQLENNKYECPICCQKITTKQGLWSCQVCYQMFHISHGCIIDWAKSSRDKEDDNRWRCPMCQNKNDKIPYNYYCFCGKQRNPTYQLGETPHSCGEVCGGKRKHDCPHPCTESCHPGPHIDCQQHVQKSCNCGKITKTVMCGSGVSVMCEDVCGKPLSCGMHSCPKICHQGECEECLLIVEQECYCGKNLKEVVCNPKCHEKYNCGVKCDGKYDCQNHQCQKTCHDRSSGCGECSQSVARIQNCPCGKKSLSSMKINRTSCTDPVPTCGLICDKLLECGDSDRKGKPHRCQELCHEGECPPCKLNTSVVCECKSSKSLLPCPEYMKVVIHGGVYRCPKRCKKRKSCLIHKCQENCCTQNEHICMQICNKRLACGSHSCDLICHAGQCAPCLEADFEDKRCHCGQTIQVAPIACGAKPPNCNYSCTRPQVCEHTVTHKCHSFPNCPPCTELTQKWCYGNHEQRKTIPCHIDSFSCGVICGKPLACGIHVCTRRCHGDSCEKEGERCLKKCEIPREGCEHICGLPCHGKTECAPSPCQTLVKVTCECGRIKNETHCWNVDKIMNSKEKDDSEASTTLKRSNSMTQLNCVKCDDECKKLERNRKVAEALAIEIDEQGETQLTPIITFPCYLKDMVRTNLDFVKTVEKVFDGMFEQLSDATNPHDNVCSHTPPLNVEKRRFIHEYAHYFNIISESVDQPPKRSVVLTATRGKSHQPLVYISELVNYKGALKTPGPTVIRKELMDEVRREAANCLNEEVKGMTTLKTTERMVYKRESRPLKQIAPSVPVTQSNMYSLLDSDVEDDEKLNVVPNSPTPKPPAEPERDWWNESDDVKQQEDGWQEVKPKLYVVEVEKEVPIEKEVEKTETEIEQLEISPLDDKEGTWEELE